MISRIRNIVVGLLALSSVHSMTIGLFEKIAWECMLFVKGFKVAKTSGVA